MIEIIKELNVEVTKPNIFQALVAKQYDMNTRFLKVTLMDCGTRINIPAIETAKVVINAERKDGQSKGFDGVINDDGTVTVPLHSWMLELDGTVICDISVIDTATDDNKKLTTTSFTLIVEKAAYGGDDVTSDPQYDVLVELIERVEQVENAIPDQTHNPESTNAQSGIAVAEAVSGCVPRYEVMAADAPFSSVLAVNNSDYNYGNENPNDFGLPNDTAYKYINVHDVDYAGKFVDCAYNYKGMIPTRDENGNLWTGNPVDDADCANKAYVDSLVGDIETLLGGI